MKLAYTMAPERGDTDLLLERLANDLAARGIRCCGTVQINSERANAGPCDMDVRVLPHGAVIRISQDLGTLARGCRLDPAALETAAGLVATGLSSSRAPCFINKFGKHEAEGRGFRDIIAKAVDMDIPVLVGLNILNLPAFETFAGGLAIALPPEPHALMAWVEEVTATAALMV